MVERENKITGREGGKLLRSGCETMLFRLAGGTARGAEEMRWVGSGWSPGYKCGDGVTDRPPGSERLDVMHPQVRASGKKKEERMEAEVQAKKGGG